MSYSSLRHQGGSKRPGEARVRQCATEAHRGSYRDFLCRHDPESAAAHLCAATRDGHARATTGHGHPCADGHTRRTDRHATAADRYACPADGHARAAAGHADAAALGAHRVGSA